MVKCAHSMQNLKTHRVAVRVYDVLQVPATLSIHRRQEEKVYHRRRPRLPLSVAGLRAKEKCKSNKKHARSCLRTTVAKRTRTLAIFEKPARCFLCMCSVSGPGDAFAPASSEKSSSPSEEPSSMSVAGPGVGKNDCLKLGAGGAVPMDSEGAGDGVATGELRGDVYDYTTFAINTVQVM